MANELSVIKPESFLALRASSNMLAAREANGEDFTLGTLVRVKNPTGGATSWELNDGLGNVEPVKEIVGALVLYRKQAVLWGSEEEPQEGVKPYLRSNDHPNLQWGYIVEDGEVGDLDPDLIELCRDPNRTPEQGNIDIRPKKKGGQFYYAEFETNKKKTGCRLKESRLLGVLRPGDPLPYLLTVQPGSLKTILPVMSRLPWPHYQAVVRLTLQKAVSATGQPYSQMMMSVVTIKDESGEVRSPLSDEQALTLKRLYTDPLNEAIRSRAIDVDGDAGPVTNPDA